MLRVLLISDSITLNTGYANTAKVIVDSLLDAKCEVRMIAWGLKEEVPAKIKLYPCSNPNDFFGKMMFKDVVEDYLPHIVMSFGDLHNTSWIANYPARFFKFINYFPIDSEAITTAQAHIIKQCDQPIVYSKTALNLVLSATQREDIKLIYHGIDTEKFVPRNKDEIKRRYGLQGKFIVGTVGRNNTRKNFPALIKAFSKFAEGKDDVILYLHSSPIDVGHNLYEFIKRYNLSGKVYITQGMDGVIGVEENELVDVYNLFDVCAISTAGEGLCLPVLEAQSCGTPVLITDYSACKEFIPKDLRIKVAAHYYEGGWDVERAIIDTDDLVDKLNKLYHNQGLLPLLSEKSRQYVEGFDWKYIKPLWEYFIKLYAEQHLGLKMDEDNPINKFIKL